MLPGIYHLNVYRGDTTRLQFRLWRDVEKTQAVDLSGAAARAQIRERPDSAVVVELVCAISGSTIDVTIPAVPAAALKQRGVWDLQLTWGSGDVQTVLQGSATAAPDVTRSAS